MTESPGRRAILVVIGAVLVGGVAAATFAWRTDQARAELHGIVVSADGDPIAGALVTLGDESDRSTTTDTQGRFVLAAPAWGGWVTATGEGWVPRTRAATPGDETVVRLLADPGGTTTVAFGGDVMFGRRFFDPAEDGSRRGQLALDASMDDHVRLLDGVAPVLAGADVAVVNLESPLHPNPFVHPLEPRPELFHPTKPFVFASLPAAAEALARAGVDVVGLGNNHLYDALEAGVVTTLDALADAGFTAGFGRFGAGTTFDEAWQSAQVQTPAGRLAFIGCTTVTGEEHARNYVAEQAAGDEPGKGGAAACDEERIVEQVRAARADGATAVVQIHGGFEYSRTPSGRVRTLSEAARDAGAALIVDHHPHVVGGLVGGDGTLTAWSLGNLIFDQAVWPTFESYVLVAAIRDGEVVGAWAEPIRLQEYRPVGVTGRDADWVARGALARSEGPWRLDDGALWLASADDPVDTTPVAVPDGGIALVGAGCGIGGGRELLWTGDFEDRDVDPQIDGGALWDVSTGVVRDRDVAAAAAAGGKQGVRLVRAGGHTRDLLLSHLHRVPVTPGHDMTALLRWRWAAGSAPATVELAWYEGTRGPSGTTSSVDLPRDVDGWQDLRLDVVVPEGAAGVGLRVRLQPPGLQRAVLDVDDIRLVDHDEQGCDTLRSDGLVRAALEATDGPPDVTIVTTDPTPIDVPARLAD